MTNYDRKKAAQIVAAILQRGQDSEYARAQLERYMPGASETELDRAVLEGNQARQIAQLIGAGELDIARGMLGGIADQGVLSWQLLAHYRIGPGEETVWRSLTMTAPPGITPEGLMSSTEAGIERELGLDQGFGLAPERGGVAMVPGSIEYVFVAPLFREG